MLGYLDGFKENKEQIQAETIEIHFYLMDPESKQMKEVKSILHEFGTLYGHHMRLNKMRESMRDLFEECGVQFENISFGSSFDDDSSSSSSSSSSDFRPENYRGKSLVGFMMDFVNFFFFFFFFFFVYFYLIYLIYFILFISIFLFY